MQQCCLDSDTHYKLINSSYQLPLSNVRYYKNVIKRNKSYFIIFTAHTFYGFVLEKHS